jgi:hypothetical protein
MKTIVVGTLIAAFMLQMPSAVLADDIGTSTRKVVPGSLNPKTNVFTPSASAAPTTVTPEITTTFRQGILIVEVNIAVGPNIPSDTVITASIQAIVNDARFSTGVSNEASATRTGDTAKVTFKMPYVFTISSTADVVTVNLSVSFSQGGTGTNPTNETINETETIPLPANGATTTVALGQKV